MIFVTVGTHHQPFSRLLDALPALDEDLVVQCGPGVPQEGLGESVPFMPFDRVLKCFRTAEKVITHAGVGSILVAIREGHVPLVVPRRADLGEHVDGHQEELTRALETTGKVIAVWDVNELPRLLAAAPTREEAEPTRAGTELSTAVGLALRGDQSSER